MKHKIRKEIEKLKEMVKNHEPVDTVKAQARKIKDSCTMVRDLLQEEGSMISALPMILKSAGDIEKDGYNPNNIKETLDSCEDMEEFDHSVLKKFDELEEKIGRVIVEEEVQYDHAKKALKELKQEERRMKLAKKQF